MDRFLQWFFRPVTYGLWVALKDPEAWRLNTNDIRHERSKVLLRDNWEYFPWFLYWVRAFYLDCSDSYTGTVGWFERHVLWRRVKKLRRHHETRASRNREAELLAKLLGLEKSHE
jgi:hypothetical protein